MWKSLCNLKLHSSSDSNGRDKNKNNNNNRCSQSESTSSLKEIANAFSPFFHTSNDPANTQVITTVATSLKVPVIFKSRFKGAGEKKIYTNCLDCSRKGGHHALWQGPPSVPLLSTTAVGCSGSKLITINNVRLCMLSTARERVTF